MWKFAVFEILIAFSSVLLVFCQEPLIEISQGQVQGNTQYSIHGRPYSQFLNIPYAQPPVGKLRFAAPLPADGWTGVRDGTVNSPQCPQTEAVDILAIGDEDCLYINVYSTQLPDGTSQPLPVMVYIYGGGYSRGSDQTWYYGPDRFMDKDLVYVTFNYRVGPFGYLSTGDSASSGNYGSLDQVLALKWVQANIAAFGGDPNHVTIQGESAGSTSVSHLILSSAAAGLFHAAIGQSGSALCSWSLQRDPLTYAIKVAEDLQCPTDDTTLLVDCLRNRTVDELVSSAWKLGDYTVAFQPFVPVVEDPDYGLFLTDLPTNILNAGTFNKVPVITGVNHDEGVITYELTPNAYYPADENFFDVELPRVVYLMFKTENNAINISYAIKAEYYDKIDVTDSDAVTITSIDFETDGVFLAPNDHYVRQLASWGVPVYTYVFSYQGSTCAHHYAGGTQVCHGDDLPYFFDTVELNATDATVSDQLIEYWTNFAINYDPNSGGSNLFWPTSTASETNYLYILQPQDTYVVSDYRSEQVYFWNNIVLELLLA